MNSTWLVGTLLTALFAAGGLVLVAVLRFLRRSPDQREQDTNAFTAVTTAQGAFTDRLEKRLDAQDTKLEQQTVKLDAMDTELTALHALNEWLIRRVAQLVAFIVAEKLTPPPEDPKP